MAASYLFTDGKFQAISSSGPVASGKLYTYAAGGTTPLATYTDQGGGTPNANPVILDSEGRASVWCSPVAYHMVLQTSAGATVWDVDNISTAGSIIADLASTTDVAKGDALVGVHRTETNAVGRTLHFYVQHSALLVANYCDPASDTPSQVATALANAITDAKSGGKALVFDPGATYTTNATTAFLGSALRKVRFWGQGATIYCNTGAVPVATLDAGGSGARCDEIEFLDFVLKGQASATYGIYMRGLCRSRIRARAFDVATAGFKNDWGVTSTFDLTCSNNVDSFSVNPATGIIITQDDINAYTSNCRFHVVMEAPITGTGVDYVYGGLGNIFTGTCEGVATGFRQRSTAADAILFGMDFESNSVCDVQVEGRGLEISGGSAVSAGSSPTVELLSTASDVSISGGFFRQIDIDSAVTGTAICDITTSDNIALGITGTGKTLWRGTGNSKVNTSRVITALIPDQLGEIGTFTGTLTGCTSSPTGTITYRRVGDVVTLNFPAINAASSSTAATLTGMPASIYPSVNRLTLGVTTSSGGDFISMIGVSTTGTITLYKTVTAAGFANDGLLKGVQTSTITYLM